MWLPTVITLDEGECRQRLMRKAPALGERLRSIKSYGEIGLRRLR